MTERDGQGGTCQAGNFEANRLSQRVRACGVHLISVDLARV